jgi:hypothetical protein
MNQSFFTDDELLSYDNLSTVLYAEDSNNEALNAFIQSNYNEIVEYYTSKRIEFLYLPYLFQDKEYQAVVNYNRPYFQSGIIDNSIAEIYQRIKSRLKKPMDGAGLVLIDKIINSSEVVYAFPLKENESLLEQFNKFATIIYEVNTEDERARDLKNVPQFKRRLPEDSIVKEVHFMTFEPELLSGNIAPRFRQTRVENADETFSYEAFILAEEIRDKIRLLKESGSLQLISDILEEIHGVSKKLSTVFITNDYRIFLKDYDMKEVIMPPLPKSLFILFVRHPEGILFKQLANYHDELLSIYRNITLRENIDLAMESIRAMTDPLNNSVNEKCSRIRAAFLEIIADDLAQNYYVTGKRGEPKMIILDRSMVEFQ